jgi:tRNA (guanine37-N1)-methyltransferase
MQIAVVTLFPGMFSALSEYGITGRAVRQQLLRLYYFSPRDYTQDRHRTVDDKPYGGGPGMLMKTGPVSQAIGAAKAKLRGAELTVEQQKTAQDAGQEAGKAPLVLYLSPQGKPLSQQIVQELAAGPDLVLLCGRYEGVDERVLETLVDAEYSLGDFVLSGGELAAMTLLDAITRLLPGALGAAESAVQDSFEAGLLDHPHYTRPEEFEGRKVPPVLLSGDHAKIDEWRLKQRLGATWRKRPDLLQKLQLDPRQQRLLDEYIREAQQQAQQ